MFLSHSFFYNLIVIYRLLDREMKNCCDEISFALIMLLIASRPLQTTSQLVLEIQPND